MKLWIPENLKEYNEIQAEIAKQKEAVEFKRFKRFMKKHDLW
jgi:hypothetical protein